MSAGDRISVCVVGGGLAGSLLAWRLASERDIARVDVALGCAFRTVRDATSRSAGVVRGFDPDLRVNQLAGESLVELYDDPRLRRWSAYREAGSLYVCATESTQAAQLACLEQQLPGSAEFLTGSQLRARGWIDVPLDAEAVFESRAGRLSPSALRGELLHELSRCRSVNLMTVSLAGVTPRDGRSVRCDLVGAQSREYDIIVLATGRWTGALLRGSGLEVGDLRTKSIECGVWRTRGRRPPPFVDETSGLYGTPLMGGEMLFGTPVEKWGVDPDCITYDAGLSDVAVARQAARRFPRCQLGPLIRRVISADSYGPSGTLSLDPVAGAGGGVFSFAGGSGGSIKTALAASRRAAAELAGSVSQPATRRKPLTTPEGTLL